MFEYLATVRSVYDGDTCRADIDLGFGIWTANQQLRLVGIDAPEMGTTEGKQARDYLRELMPVGTTVRLKTHKDAAEKYGRWLAEIYLPADGLYVNAAMVASGHAVLYDGGPR